MINGGEEARARVDEVMLSSWLSLIGPSRDGDHNTGFVGGRRGGLVRASVRAHTCSGVRVCACTD